MGTNYYVTSPWRMGQLHLGKSSAGWCFSLHVSVDIPNLEAWKPILLKNTIKNEYGELVSYSDMMKIITGREWLDRKYPFYCQYRITEVKSLEHHAELEGCEVGPNNLFRHKIDMIYCVGHGAGTWDHIIGEFS